MFEKRFPWKNKYQMVHKLHHWEDYSDVTESMFEMWACTDWEESVQVGKDWVCVDFGLPGRNIFTCWWEGADAVSMWRNRRAGRDAAWNASIRRWRMHVGYFNQVNIEPPLREVYGVRPDIPKTSAWFWKGTGYFGDAELDAIANQEVVEMLDECDMLLPSFLELVVRVTGFAVYANGNELLFVNAVAHVVHDAMERFEGRVKYGFIGK